MMFFEVKIQQNSSRFNKNSRNNVFRTKQRAKKVRANIFRGFQIRKIVRLMFWTTKHSMNGKYHVFSGYKERSKVRLVYLEGKPQEERYGWCIFKLKCKKKHIYRQANNKQGTTIVLRCWRAYQKLIIVLFHPFSKEGR